MLNNIVLLVPTLPVQQLYLVDKQTRNIFLSLVEVVGRSGS
jgi:hypothetical protein